MWVSSFVCVQLTETRGLKKGQLGLETSAGKAISKFAV